MLSYMWGLAPISAIWTFRTGWMGCGECCWRCAEWCPGARCQLINDEADEEEEKELDAKERTLERPVEEKMSLISRWVVPRPWRAVRPRARSFGGGTFGVLCVVAGDATAVMGLGGRDSFGVTKV